MGNLKYLHGCTLCGDGVCDRMEELMAEGLAESKAAVAISAEITLELGEEMYSFSAIKSRYRRLTGKDSEGKEPDFEGLDEDEDDGYKTPKQRMQEEIDAKKPKKPKTPKEEPVGSGMSATPMLGAVNMTGPQWEWEPDDVGVKDYCTACWYIGGDDMIRPEGNLYLLDKAFKTFSEPESEDEIAIFRQLCLCKKIIEAHIKKNF